MKNTSKMKLAVYTCFLIIAGYEAQAQNVGTALQTRPQNASIQAGQNTQKLVNGIPHHAIPADITKTDFHDKAKAFIAFSTQNKMDEATGAWRDVLNMMNAHLAYLEGEKEIASTRQKAQMSTEMNEVAKIYFSIIPLHTDLVKNSGALQVKLNEFEQTIH